MIYQRQRAVHCARWLLEFFKFDLNIVSLNKGSSEKDTLDDGINMLGNAVNVEQNDVRPYMSELTTNTTMMDMTQTPRKIPQKINIPKIDNEDERIALIILYRLIESSLLLLFSSLYKHTQQNWTVRNIISPVLHSCRPGVGLQLHSTIPE